MEFFDLRTLALIQGALVFVLVVLFVLETFNGASRWTDSHKDRRRNGEIPFNPMSLRVLS